jgi:serine/threonine protein kinase
MVDFLSICPNCCKESDSSGICPICGIASNDVKNEEYCVPAGSILLDRYYIGKVIGQGGFGITYLGYDTKFKTKIAVKEYFPHGYAYRELHKERHTVYSLSGEKTEFFNRGMEKFIAEAQRLAHFSGAPGIVNVRDYFNENNTAYIVMEFVEGEPLKSILEKRGKLSEAETITIFLPILKTLQRVHAAGILHRDIAPDNIMVEPDGTARLIDFGASAEIDESAATSAAVIKHFYVPEEQYDTNRRRQGSWTDVYAVSATIFKTLEGQNIPDAIERLRGVEFKGFTLPVSKPVSKAVMHGLALLAKDRAQTVDELIQVFSEREALAAYDKTKVKNKFEKAPKPKKEKKIKPKKEKIPKPETEKPTVKKTGIFNKKKLIAVISGIAAVVVVVSAFIVLPKILGEATITDGNETATSTNNLVDNNTETATAIGTVTTARSTSAEVNTTKSPNVTTALAVTEKTVTDGYVENFRLRAAFEALGFGDYTGNLKNGQPDGYGVFTFSKASYEGNFVNGIPHGEGTLIRSYITGSYGNFEYTGDFVNGKYEGQGTLICSYSNDTYNNSEYTGDFVNGEFEGQGKLIRPNNWEKEYTGSFKNGELHGSGVMVDANGTIFEGTWKNGQKNGKFTQYDIIADDEYWKPGKNWIKTIEYIDDLMKPNQTVEQLGYLQDGGIRTDYYVTDPSGDHFLGNSVDDPRTLRHVKVINPDGSFYEWDDVYEGNEWIESISE